MSASDEIARVRSSVPSLGSQVAEFVQMVDSLAEVIIGDSRIQIPTVGYAPPVPGMSVQVENRDGKYVVTGPAAPPTGKGTIAAALTPQAEVTVDGEPHMLPYLSSYTPAVGDVVAIDWSRDAGLILGKFTTETAPTPVAPPTDEPAGEFSTDPIRAERSGRYQNSWWGNSDVWATNNNKGIWTYGSRIQSALKGTNPTRMWINLPLLQQRGAAFIGLHTYSTIPGGAPTITDTVALPVRSGKVELPGAWAVTLRDGAGGIGVTSGSGYNIWKGVGSDPLSGALTFSGTR